MNGVTDLAIIAKGISKRYLIGEREKYFALRDVLTRALMKPIRVFRNGRQAAVKRFIWALKDVSLEVKRGQILGIVGRNGAGKSTLLKILSRITKPTQGYAEIRGRVGSLLEVGTGFHYELTGRENIFLNGVILGMKKAEIRRKFDEIVAFSEVEQFIDTPVKYYSTGMYLRLAFAVAAHLEPEILLMDEVLAVGDIAFQKKCLGKMGDVASEGRTVLFVSHQMGQIRRLCQKCIWIEAGRICKEGPTAEVLAAYEEEMSGLRAKPERFGNHSKARFLGWEVEEPRTTCPNFLDSMGSVTVTFTVQVNHPVRMGHHGIALFDSEGQLMWASAVNNLELSIGQHVFRHRLPYLPLRPGTYHWSVSLYDDRGLLDVWHCIPDFIIATKPCTHPSEEWSGILNVPSQFSLGDRTSKSQ